MALDRWDNTKELYNKEADCVEADAGGTPAGDKVPFPWVKDKVSAAASSTPGATVPSRMCAPGAQTNLADSSDPLHLLAKLTMMLSHKNCHSTLVPQDLRTLVSTEIRQTAIKLEDGFLQRLQDLDIVSTAYVEELTNLKKKYKDHEIIEDFLAYLFRKGMVAVLNFTKVLYEEQHFDLVKKIVDLMKSRKYLAPAAAASPASTATRASAVYVPESSVKLWEIDVKKGSYSGSSRVYDMSSFPRGHVLLINNEDFSDSGGQFSNRHGTSVDGDKLASLFTKLSFVLYRGQQFKDLTKKEMSDLIEEFASYEDHQSVHACVVIILSHGKDQGRIAGVDGEYITDSDVQEKFHANNCPHLAGKPKIFLFVACRGGGIDVGLELVPSINVASARMFSDNVADSPVEFRISSEVTVGGTTYPAMKPPASSRIPNAVDFISIYATVPGYQSLRHLTFGTWFVQDFVEVVAAEAYLSDLATMVCEVNNRLSERMSQGGEKQSLICHTTLRKSLFFNPGF